MWKRAFSLISSTGAAPIEAGFSFSSSDGRSNPQVILGSEHLAQYPIVPAKPLLEFRALDGSGAQSMMARFRAASAARSLATERLGRDHNKRKAVARLLTVVSCMMLRRERP